MKTGNEGKAACARKDRDESNIENKAKQEKLFLRNKLNNIPHRSNTLR
jgi:hypothetical protein